MRRLDVFWARCWRLIHLTGQGLNISETKNALDSFEYFRDKFDLFDFYSKIMHITHRY